MAEITDDITDDDTVSLVAITADGYGHIPGTNIAAVLGIDQGQSLDPELGRPAVKTVATVNVTLSGEQTIAGAACVDGDRVLPTAQTNAEENRPYVVASGAWAAAGDSLVSGAWWYALAGNNAGLWQLTTADPIVPGTTELAIVLRATGNTAAHASSHAAAGGDAVTIAESQVTGLTAALAAKAASDHDHDTTYAPLSGSVDATYSVRMASDGVEVAALGEQTVLFDTALAAVSGFSLSSGEITLGEAATYEIDADFACHFTSASVKGGCAGAVQTDNSGSWAAITGAEFFLAHSGGSSVTGYQRGFAHVKWFVTTTATNKKIRARIGPSMASSSSLVMMAGQTRMTVKRIAA